MLKINRILTVVTMIVAMAAPSWGADDYFDGGSGGTGTDWNTGDNWDNNVVPSGDTEITGTYSPVLENDVSDIEVLRVGGGADLTVKTGADLTITNSKAFSDDSIDSTDQWGAFAVGVNSTGTVVQQGGTIVLGGDVPENMFVGMNVVEIGGPGSMGTGGVGTYTLQDGLLDLGKQVRIGNGVGSTGTFNLEGGTLTAAVGIYLGNDGVGTFVISGDATSINNTLRVGEGAAGTLRLEGSEASFTCNDMENHNSTLDFVADAAGISTINVTTEVDEFQGTLLVNLDALTGPNVMTLVATPSQATLGTFDTVTVTKDGTGLALGAKGALNVGEYFLDYAGGTGTDLVLSVNLPYAFPTGTVLIIR